MALRPQPYIWHPRQNNQIRHVFSNMAKIHFLNVGNGDCTIVEHDSGRNTVIDINQVEYAEEVRKNNFGNLNQKSFPTDPIQYLKKHSISDIFRFVLTRLSVSLSRNRTFHGSRRLLCF